ncbi:MAG: cobalamin B12-binding domain-containing protein [Gammaproteobacteria bacterium]|nr:cobalamin B12-binding domain-containing protein [Gammaproteobacteria bacterium]
MSTTKVCLIRPSIFTTADSLGVEIMLPFGIAYLAAYLRQESFDVSMIDALGAGMNQYTPLDDLPNGLLRGLSDQETTNRIPSNVDMIGISSMFSVNWVVTRRLLQIIRRRFPSVLLIIGGEHATAMPEYCLRDAPEIDYVVIGEGEHTTAQLLKMLEAGGEPESVPGVAFIRDNQYIASTARARERDLSVFPWPAWDLLSVEDYLHNVTASLDHGRTMPIMTSRGCPYDCTFCSNPGMWGHLWRARSPEDVVTEIEHNVRTYRITHLDFLDLTTITKRSWMIEFCNLLIKRNLAITWQIIATRAEAIDAEVTRWLKRAGCSYITYAPESGSDRVLASIRKKMDKEAMLVSISSAVDAGIGVKMNFVAGFPDDRLSDILASYWMAVRAAWHGAHDASFFPFAPYPGSELFRRLVDEGKIEINDQFFFRLALYSVGHMKSVANHFNDKSLRWLCLAGMASFYCVSFFRRPNRIWRLIRDVARAEGKTKLSAILVMFIKNRRRIKSATAGG